MISLLHPVRSCASFGIKEDAQNFYKNLTSETIDDDIDGFSGEVDLR